MIMMMIDDDDDDEWMERSFYHKRLSYVDDGNGNVTFESFAGILRY